MLAPHADRMLLDTNVLMDYLLQRDEPARTAEAVMELGAVGKISLLCASLSLKDIAYLSAAAIRRQFRQDESELENVTLRTLVTHVPWRCIERVRALCDIVEVGQSTCDDAMALRKRHNDFEDDLIIASAKEAGAECVITSDAELIAHFPEYCTTPRTIVASMG